MNGLQIAPLLLAVAAMASVTKALAVAKTKNSKQSLRARMPFALPTESVRMAAMASDAILSEALKKCQLRSGLVCVLPVFVKRLSLENVSVPRERKTIAEGATANSIVYPFMGRKRTPRTEVNAPLWKRACPFVAARLSQLFEAIEHN